MHRDFYRSTISSVIHNMKKLLLLLFILLSNLSYGQIKAVVVNSTTKEKVPYVNIWVMNEDIGTTSSTEGAFELKIDEPKAIRFSAIGYETKIMNADEINASVELQPSVTSLAELVVTPKEFTREVTVGAFKKSDIKSHFGCATTPGILARYFEYKEEYDETVFLKKIKMLTRSKIKDAKFNLHFYRVNENGEPGADILSENFIGTAPKGRKIIETDLSDYHIAFPKEGLFVAVEWLLIESNKHEYEAYIDGSNKKGAVISHEPDFGTIPIKSEGSCWHFVQGKWRSMSMIPETPDYPFSNHLMLAVELTLTN